MRESSDNVVFIRRLLTEYRDNDLPLCIKMVYKIDRVDKFLFYGQIYPKLNDIEFKTELLEYNKFSFYQAVFQPNEYRNWDDFLSIFQGDSETNTQSNYYVRVGEVVLRCDKEKILINRYSTQLKGYKDLNLAKEFTQICSIHLSDIQDYSHSNLTTDNAELHYYPTIRDLIWDKFGFKLNRMDTFRGKLHFPVYSIKGYIDRLEIKDDEAKLFIKKNTEEILILKVFGELYNEKRCFKKIERIIENSIVISLPKNFIRYSIILIDNEGERQDHKEYEEKDFLSADFVERLILGGERVTVEFKVWVSNLKDSKEKEKRRTKYAKLMTSFANTKGGYILFGVTNDSVVQGIGKGQKDEIDKLLQNIITANITPRIEVSCSEVIQQTKRICVARVEKSTELVQCDENYYIRLGGTTRIMRANEICNFQPNSTIQTLQNMFKG